MPIRIWNFLGEFGSAKKIEVNNLIKKARRQTGLLDFGDDFFMTSLEVLIESINREAQLHAFGKFVTKARIVNLLCNRLRTENFLKLHPEINEINLLPTWCIIGLQRTGTTFLQRLLSASPDSATVHSWEALNPIPFRNDPHNKKRIALARKSEAGLRYIAPDFFAIHPVEHLSPEEEILLLDISFMSTVPEATLNVPSYANWLEKQDQTQAYDYMRTLLKILQFKKVSKKRWILKSPHHMEYTETLLKVFPETKFIFTHRDPLETIASFCSMIYFSRRIFTEEPDRFQIAAHWLRKVKIMLEKYLDFRKSKNDITCTDVSYKELVSNPVRECERIFESFGEDFCKIDKQAMEDFLKMNLKNQLGSHRYSLEDFGLDKEDLEKDFSGYKMNFLHYL